MDALDKQLQAFVSANPRLFVLTGAGCSTASGLGDYRDREGRWKRRQPINGNTFIGDEFARRRYWARSYVGWPGFSRARPGNAHTALASLQQTGRLTGLVTQNVDRLHQKAGHQGVIDLHGVLETVSCITCRYTLSRDEFQQSLLLYNPWIATLTAVHAPDGDADLELDDLNRMSVPECPACGGILKPDVVFFGENVPRERVLKAMEALAVADALLVAGSSLMVYSGFRFCRAAHSAGQPIAIVNDGVTRADELAELKIGGDCGKRLQQLAAAIAQASA